MPEAEARGWKRAENGASIAKEFTFKNFIEALSFANKIGSIAESANHHPDLSISWGKVVVTLSTHSIGGLSDKDFDLAAKIDAL